MANSMIGATSWMRVRIIPQFSSTILPSSSSLHNHKVSFFFPEGGSSQSVPPLLLINNKLEFVLLLRLPEISMLVVIELLSSIEALKWVLSFICGFRSKGGKFLLRIEGSGRLCGSGG
ncbi:hypothetical protein OIU84_007016 [Salix udensis]|uniref:Uncharacterized protein n=1 Tax=Salix udensis TaxID=889485 RepID=A0AAD6P359_9ROSI|nr:hypothetical protein OIU84_007016 [Salix udensis]